MGNVWSLMESLFATLFSSFVTNFTESYYEAVRPINKTYTETPIWNIFWFMWVILYAFLLRFTVPGMGLGDGEKACYDYFDNHFVIDGSDGFFHIFLSIPDQVFK